jgi:hypothetical protein
MFFEDRMDKKPAWTTDGSRHRFIKRHSLRKTDMLFFFVSIARSQLFTVLTAMLPLSS